MKRAARAKIATSFPQWHITPNYIRYIYAIEQLLNKRLGNHLLKYANMLVDY
jgi:hypothetical protein